MEYKVAVMSQQTKPYQIAVIIPTLNEERFIDRCLKSVLHQTYLFEHLDILVVDGGSSDSTQEIVKQWCARYSNVRLLYNHKRIQSVAFNLGVRESNAPYIVRLDAHAEYYPRYIELCYIHLSQHPEYGNVGGVWDIQPQNGSAMAVSNALINQSMFGIGGAAFRIGANAGEVETVPFGAFPRKMIDEVGGMNENLARGEDNEYNCRIRKAGYKIYLDPEIVCTYYARPTFLSSIKQMYTNGRSIGQLFYVDYNAISLRHLVPLAFVTVLIGGVLLSIVCKIFAYILLLVFSLYLLLAFAETVRICRKNGWRYFFALPLLFLGVHISYGWGTIVGLITKK